MDNLEDKARAYRRQRIQHWDGVAKWHRGVNWFRQSYHKLLQHHFRLIVPPGARVLELGCGTGDLLAALEPSFGVGLDFSGVMLTRANEKYPQYHFVQADAHAIPMIGVFDYVIVSDLVNDLWDVQTVFNELARLPGKRTHFIINAYSRLWQLPLGLAGLFRLKTPNLEQNWLMVEDLENLLDLGDCEIVKKERAILLPAGIPLLAQFANQFLVKLWPFSQLALTNIVIARPNKPILLAEKRKQFSISVIIPARNEEGNIAALFNRIPELGSHTELVFVEGHSRDATYERIASEIPLHLERKASLLRQDGIGKADAVWQGFAAAQGEILMILDADLSVPPEDLVRFYEALASGKAEFVNGVRLVYPMEERAMRSLNLIGNKFFSMTFSWLLGQSIKDTLCGTKALWKQDFVRITQHWPAFGKHDPFGDFDLLFGAAKLGLKIVDMPIRYKERVYGTTNIDRWRHGMMLLRMVMLAARRLKFV